MTQASIPVRPARDYTPAGLHHDVRALHRGGLAWITPAWLCIIAAFMLSVMGVLAISTTTEFHAARQIAFLCVSLLAASAAVVPHFRWLFVYRIPLLVIVLLLLVFVLIPMVPEAIVRPRNGARRWINLGVTDFQPSELAKLAYIIILAGHLRYQKNYRRFLGLFVPFVLTFIPMALILVEPDLGTALLFVPTLFAMLIAAGAKLKHLVLIIALGVVSAPLMYPLLQPHQKDRINALYYQLKGDQRHVQDIGYQGDKAMTLVGSGQLTGNGEQRAADLVLHNHLPEEHNDMVFAVVCCRWGAVGAAMLWGTFALFAVGGLWTAAACRDPFGRLVAVGIIAILFAQMTINTAMTVGIMPITGMTLPFVSYGGSSLVSAWLMVGVLLNIGLRRPHPFMKESFEFDHEEEGA